MRVRGLHPVLSKMSLASLLPPPKSSKLPRRLLGSEELVEAGIDDVTSVVVGGSALEKVAGVALPPLVSQRVPRV
jgi:hypothetical protein